MHVYAFSTTIVAVSSTVAPIMLSVLESALDVEFPTGSTEGVAADERVADGESVADTVGSVARTLIVAEPYAVLQLTGFCWSRNREMPRRPTVAAVPAAAVFWYATFCSAAVQVALGRFATAGVRVRSHVAVSEAEEAIKDYM